MGRAAPTLTVGEVEPDTLVRLDVAARLAFPDGSISLSSLRREAARGRLTIWRVANKDMTTLAEIRSMIERCRVLPCPPDYGSDRPPETGPRPGSSSTADVRSAQAAARLRVTRLKGSSSNTSGPSTMRRPEPNVVPIKPR